MGTARNEGGRGVGGKVGGRERQREKERKGEREVRVLIPWALPRMTLLYVWIIPSSV